MVIGIVVLLVVVGGGYYLYTNSNGGTTPATTQDPSQTVQAQDTKVGTGAQAEPGTIVSVLYVGMLEDGTVFDSSEAHGNEALRFQLGTPGIIPGFQIGVNGMKEGGERRMVVPASFGYGGQDVKDAEGKVIIHASSTLVFDVKLVKVEPAPAEDTSTKTQ